MRFMKSKSGVASCAFIATLLAAGPVVANDVDDLQKIYCPTASVTVTPPGTSSSVCPDPASNQNILIVVDTSHRMDVVVNDPSKGSKTRLELAKIAIHELLDKLECANVGLMRTHTFGGPILYPVAPLDSPSIWDEESGLGYDNKISGYTTDPNPTQACKSGTCSARDNSAASTNKKLVRDRLHELVDQLGTMVNAPMTSTFYEAIEYFRGGRVLYGLGRGPNFEGDGGLGSATGGVNEKSDWTLKVPVVMRRIGRGGNDINNNNDFMWPRAGITQSARIKSHVSHPASYTGGARYVPSGCNGWHDTSNGACDHENIFTNAGSIPTYVSPVKNQNQMNNIIFISQGIPDFDDMRWPLFSDKLTRNDGRDCSARESSGNRIQSDARNNTYRPNNGGGNPDKKYCTYQKKSVVSANRMAYQDGWMRHWHHQFWRFDPYSDEGQDQGGAWFKDNRSGSGNYWGFAWLDMSTTAYNWDENWWPWGSPPPGAPSEESVHNKALITSGQDWSKKDVVDRMFSVREERPEGQACRDFNNEYLQFVKWTACSIDQAEWAYSKGINDGGYTTSDGKKPWGLKKLRVYPISYSYDEDLWFPDDSRVGTQWRWRVNPDNRSGKFVPTDFLRHFAWRANSGGDFGKQIFEAKNYSALAKALAEKGTDSGNNSIVEQASAAKVTVTVNESTVTVQNDQAAYASVGAGVNNANRFANDDRVLLSFFEPSNKLHWKGNVKLYKYAGGQVKDKDDKALMKSNTSNVQSYKDFYNSETTSVWAPPKSSDWTNDGQAFLKNGFGAQLRSATYGPVTRKILTNLTSSTTLTDINDSAVQTAVASDLSLSSANAASFVSWVKGDDVLNEDSEGTARWSMGAVLNSSPVTLRYNQSGTSKDIAFVGTLSAYLHAIDMADGTEKFAFVPREMWSYQKNVMNNPSVVASSNVSGAGIGGLVGGTGVEPFTKTKTNVSFRGTPNSWGETPMTLVGNKTWATVQTYTSGQGQPPRFKVYADGTWQPDPDVGVGGTGVFWTKYVDTASGVSAADVSFGQAYSNSGFYGRRSSVSFRGTPNNWGETAMKLVDNFVWETYQVFAANGEFKFYTNSQWVGVDGATANGTANIAVTAGAGTYRIRFNDLTYQYTMMLGTYKEIKVVNGTDLNNAVSMKMISANLWEANVTYAAAASARFYIPESGAYFGGPSPATAGGAGIALSAGSYTVRFTDTTKAYVFGGETSSYASGGIDGPLTVWVDEDNASRNGQLDKASSGPDKETAYLFVTQRRGGNNIYALNVTDYASPKLAWKINADTSGFNGLGQTWSSPTLAKLKLDTGSGIKPVDVLVFGGGYDAAQDTVTNGTDTLGHAIYVVEAKTGNLVHRFVDDHLSGSNTTPVEGGLDYSIPADVAAYDYDRDGITDFLFAADTGGRVIRADFKLDNTGKSVVKAAGIIADFSGSGADRRRFFNKPDVALAQHPTNKSVALAVSVGSGHRGRPASDAANDMMFTVFEDLHLTTETPPFAVDGFAPVLKAHLVNIDNPTASVTARTPVEGITTRMEMRGFYLDLPGDKEKILARAVMANHQLFFTSYKPNTADCSPEAGSGDGKLYVIDVWQKDPDAKRWRSDDLAMKGIPPEPRVVFEPRETTNNNDPWSVKPRLVVGSHTIGSVDAIEIDFGSLIEKVTWEQQIQE